MQCRYCNSIIESGIYCDRKCYQKHYYKLNKTKISSRQKQWYKNNTEKIKTRRATPEAKLISDTWYFKNRKRLVSQQTNRKQEDINFKLTRNLRSRLWIAIKRNYKSGSAIQDLGCTIDFLKKYLESQFQEGMSWSNYGEWHIDHVIPLSSFDLTDRTQFLKACHYTNLQPLWAVDNIKKSNKFTTGAEPNTMSSGDKDAK